MRARHYWIVLEDGRGVGAFEHDPHGEDPLALEAAAQLAIFDYLEGRDAPPTCPHCHEVSEDPDHDPAKAPRMPSTTACGCTTTWCPVVTFDAAAGISARWRVVVTVTEGLPRCQLYMPTPEGPRMILDWFHNRQIAPPAANNMNTAVALAAFARYIAPELNP